MADDHSNSFAAAPSRAIAKSLGLPTYTTGKPCSYGHDSPRRTASGHCDACLSAARAAKRGCEAALKWAAESKAFKAARDASEANRLAAIDRGESTYLGAKCHRGHSGIRYVGGYGCVGCFKTTERVSAKSAYDQQYRLKNPEKCVARSAAWRRANPELRLAISKAYKARRRSHEQGGDSTVAIAAWERAAKKVCYWCGCKCPKKYQVDHYQPLARGGRHEVKNLVISCGPCNRRKNAKDPYQFAQTMGKLF